MPFQSLKIELSKELEQLFKHPEIQADMLFKDFSVPPNIQLGHLALPCFKISKLLKKNPNEIATIITQHFSNHSNVRAFIAGPYANFKFDLMGFYSKLTTEIFSDVKNYGSDDSGSKNSVIIEYCSPNIAKPLAFQHIRSTLIGNVLANIYKFFGYDTLRMNFVGDWGTQFAKLLAAIEKWGDQTKLSTDDVSKAMQHLFELYVRFHKEAENNTDYDNLASVYLQRLEQGDTRATDLWKKIREISVLSMQKTLKRLHVEFDQVEGESDYTQDIDKTLEHIKKKASAVQSEGAWIVQVDGIETPALIQKRDGTTLYLTRDIAAAEHRYAKHKFTKMLYVVSEQQKLHFQLLFGVLLKMGQQWASGCEHVSFGTVFFGEEKMSTRMGKVIFLDDILNQAQQLALKLCSEKNPELPNKEKVAEDVGIAAVIFGELSTHRIRDFEFDWKHVLAFDGETGPYVQYSLVRCYSLLEKAQDEEMDLKTFTGSFCEEEETLILTLAKFRQSLLSCIAENEPFYLTKYLVDVAKSFNRFYYKVPVLQSQQNDLKQMRLTLVRCTQVVLENGLRLLGIQCPKEM